jgi:cellulose synthase/poly-beta-1,6-N-acetylglucosamine synthase-like glycosyltransferase
VLPALLVGALTAAVLSTIALFGVAVRRSTGRALPWSRRLVFALVGTALLAASSWAAALFLTEEQSAANAAFVATAVASLAWLPLTRRWNARAHLCWASNSLLYVVYLAFMLNWTFQSPLGWAGLLGALLLWVLEVFAGLLGAAYLWELCDALGSEHWRRRSRAGLETGAVPQAQPFVSFHVPAHEEPPEMVIETLQSLLAIDYPAFEVVAIDDNTTDEALWRPVEQWCAEHGVTFAHLEDWPGYKSGALNYALRELTDPRAEVIGIVDSDYQISPDFLSRCAPLFADPDLGFVQSPQDYRDWEFATFHRRLYYSYKYFFSVSQPSRNERDGAIFAGTMGLIRRSALESVGGWDEWCITEDAELSLRLLRDGWSGLHVDTSYGHGVMPLTFEALKGQRFRWCFGGIQILRVHWRSMLPAVLGGRSGKDNRLTGGQRWAYLSGALQWYGDLLGLVFFFFLLGGALNIALGGGLLFRKLSAFLLAAIPLLVVLGFVRAVALIRRGTGASWHDAVGAFLIWQSTSLVVARASVQALFAKKAEFLRTPKTSEETSVWRALTANKAEVVLALLGMVGIAIGLAHVTTFSGALTAALLVVPTIAYAAAPWHSLLAQRAALPPEMARRRATEARRSYFSRSAAATGTGVVLVGALVAGVFALLGTGSHEVSPPRLRPDHEAAHDRGPASPSDQPTKSPSNSPSEGPTSGPTSGAPSSGAPSSTAPTSSAPSSSPATSSPPTSSAPTSSAPPTSTAPSSAPASTAAASTSPAASPTP